VFAKILYVQFTPPLLKLDTNRPNKEECEEEREEKVKKSVKKYVKKSVPAS